VNSLNEEIAIKNDLVYNNQLEFIQVGNEPKDTDDKDYRLYIAKPINPYQTEFEIANFMNIMPQAWQNNYNKNLEHHYNYMALEIAKGNINQIKEILNNYSLSEFHYYNLLTKIYGTFNAKM